MGQRRRDPIPIHLGLNNAGESAYLSVANQPAVYNAIVDVRENEILVGRRPGLQPILDLDEADKGIDGLHWWERFSKLVAISNGKGFTMDSTGGGHTDLTGTYFTAGNRVIFADYGDEGSGNLYAADGGKINSISTSAVTEMADTDAPQLCKFVAVLDKYLLGNNLTSARVHRSDVGAPTTWGSNYFTAEAKDDEVLAIAAENLELYLLGQNSLEIWEDTGADDPFSRIPGGYVATGTIAPYTFKFCGEPVNSFVWLDNQLRLVMLQGRTPISLSESLNRYLQQSSSYTISDAAGDFFNVLGHPLYVLHLPTEDETIVYDFTNGLWQRWSYWDSTGETHERWWGNYCAHSPEWNAVYAGKHDDSIIYKLNPDLFADFNDTMRMLMRTAEMDRGDIGAIKRTNSLTFAAKRTSTNNPTNNSITINVRYRDNGSATWSTARAVSLTSSATDLYYRAKTNAFGRYYTRQWEFYSDDKAGFALLPPVEDYEISY